MCAGVFYEELLMIATVVFYNKIGENKSKNTGCVAK